MYRNVLIDTWFKFIIKFAISKKLICGVFSIYFMRKIHFYIKLSPIRDLLFVDIISDAKLDITGSKTLYHKQIKTNKILAWPVNCSELSLGD